ncbi:MAG: secondary thiamine-phosphate synthase enzyme YjbQ [Candidatus Competibacterales bacterium]
MFHRQRLEISTPGRATLDITPRVAGVVAAAPPGEGLCQVFLHHTSASLFINENADPDVQRDLEAFMARLVVDGDPRHRHQSEGPDDMAAHIRTLLTQVSLTVPVAAGRLDLGTWQGIFLWEHRHRPHRRRLTVTVWGGEGPSP